MNQVQKKARRMVRARRRENRMVRGLESMTYEGRLKEVSILVWKRDD